LPSVDRGEGREGTDPSLKGEGKHLEGKGIVHLLREKKTVGGPASRGEADIIAREDRQYERKGKEKQE